MIGTSDTDLASAAPHRAVIDIGSNTVRLVIYGGARRVPTVLLNEKVVAQLGRDLPRSGEIPAAGMRIALAGLKRYRRILSDLHVGEIDVIATAAARIASNGEALLSQVRECGFEPRLLSGEEEARTSAMGVIGAFPGAKGVVADLGGGSIELIEIGEGQAAHGISLPFGSLMLAEMRAAGSDQFKRKIGKALQGADWAHPVAAPLYMVGGTWRSLACFAMADSGHPLADPHGFTLDAARAARLAKRVRLMKSSKLTAPRVGEMRAAVLPHAAALLQVLLARLQPTKLVFSSWGLREGRLFDRLDPAAKAQDPLLAGVAHFAAPRGGPPTLATRIAGWSADALPANGRGSERLRLAATMLALAAMQIEPNLRLRQAINWALYKRWIDLTDEGRAMIAAAVSANCGSLDLPKPLGKLAGQDALDEGACWGLAIRLARRLGAGSRNSLRNSALVVHKHRLVLYLGESHAELWAGHVESDLAALAKRLGLTPAMEVVPNDRLPFTAARAEVPIEV